MSGVSTSELLKLEMVLKTVCAESSESMSGKFEENLGSRQEVRSEIEMQKEWRWKFERLERERLRDPICRLIVSKW